MRQMWNDFLATGKNPWKGRQMISYLRKKFGRVADVPVVTFQVGDRVARLKYPEILGTVTYVNDGTAGVLSGAPGAVLAEPDEMMYRVTFDNVADRPGLNWFLAKELFLIK